MGCPPKRLRCKLLTLRKLLVYTAAVYFAAAPPVHAQIYSWRDANGNLVLSNRSRAGATTVRSYAVPQAEKVRATRFVAADRGRVYDDVIGEHARLNGVRTDLIKAVVQVESGFNPYAKSPK